MQTVVLSKGEKKFQQELLDTGVRLDGREAMEMRKYTTFMSPLSLSPASCRVIWGHGYGDTTELIVSVSTELAKRESSEPVISLKALDGAFGEEVDQSEICQVVQSTLIHFIDNSGCIDRERLSVANSPYSWKLFVDILVIKAAGAVYEASMLGIRRSLAELSFPHLLVTPGEALAELHFDIDETKESMKLIDVDKIPFVVSFAAANNILLIDPTPLELTVVGSLVVLGLTADGKVLGFNHFGERGMKSWVLAEITGHTEAILPHLRGDHLM